VKWELFPQTEGKVKIYSSFNPDFTGPLYFEQEKSISDGFSIMSRKEDDRRQFFRLVFDKKYTAYVSERHIATDRISNLRDLGGYFRGKTRQMKWAKLYRSGALAWMSEKDEVTLDSLHIKTIVDLRDERTTPLLRTKYNADQTIHLGLHMLSIDTVRQKILNDQMKKGDVLISLQDMYAHVLEKDTTSLIQLFDILTDEERYPLLYHCFLGKDHAGLVSILILEALGIDRELIFYDYMLSNQFIDFSRIISKTSDLSHEAEAPLATLISANEQLFNFVYDKVRMDYGSMNQYLSNVLHVTDKKREKLREILFYQ